MKEKITLFASSNLGRGSINTYACCMYCTGTFTDLKYAAQYFQSIFKRKNGEDINVPYLYDINDFQRFDKFIHLIKNTLSFHINVKDIAYYFFIYFWNKVLFKDFEIKNDMLWYEMINDVCSNINKNDFISFSELHLARIHHNNKESFQKRIIENICNQIKQSNSCTTDVKKHIEALLPINHHLNTYIHKQLDAYSFRNIETEHIINFYQKGYVILAENNKTDKVYINESADFFPLFKGLTTKYLDIEPVEPCLKDVITMLDFLRDLFLCVFQRLEQKTIDKNERKKLFYILFDLFQLTEIDSLELEIDDKMFGILQSFIKANY